MHVNEKSAKNVLWKSANLLTEHCALHQFLDRYDLNKTNPTSQKWEKNYIDIFIWCGEIHLYAFFLHIFSKKPFWYQILARETDYRVLHYSHGQKTHMPCIKVDKTYMSRFIITGLVPLYAYFYILPNYSAFSLKIPTRDLW